MLNDTLKSLPINKFARGQIYMIHMTGSGWSLAMIGSGKKMTMIIGR